MIRLCIALLFIALLPRAGAQVVINEVSAAASDRNIQFGADGTPRLGSGIPWNAPSFNDAAWSSGNLPAGYGTTVNTNLQTAMLNKTPTLYLRKTFNVTPSQAALTSPLILQVEVDDGFIAFINGVEVGRANCGPAKHFLYVAQPAYNAATTTGITEYTLGAANAFLVSGTNVLTIQAHNYSVGTNFRANAGLRLITSSTNIAVTNALFDFSNANGASRTHTNTSGTITNVTTGSPPAGGWLATAANPTSDNTWTSLQIVSAEQQGAGLGGSGGIRYAITQSGTNRSVTLHAPQISMANAWALGGINLPALAASTVKFRYRTTGDVQFGFRLDPVVDLAASSVDGFPTIGAPLGGPAWYDWTTTIAGANAAASGGFYGQTIDAVGGKSTSIGGSINIANYEALIGPGVRSGQVTLKEDNAAGIGPGGTTGVFSYTLNTMPAVVDSLGFGIKGITVSAWNPPNILVSDFQRSRVSFRWKMPVGRQMAFYLEPNFGGTAAQRAAIGTLTGTGNWETYAATLGDLPSGDALRTKLNTQGSNGKVVKFTGNYVGVSFNNGDQVLIDDLRVSYTLPGTEAEEEPAKSFGSATAAARTRTIDGAGVPTDSTSGTPAFSFTLNSDPALTGFAFRVTEDNTAGAGNNSSTGFLRCEVTDVADTGGPWGFSVPGMKAYNWTAGSISVPDLSDISLQLAAKIPAGVTVQLYAEPVGGSTANRANLGTLTGNGTWQSFSFEFATAGNVEAFRTALNAGTTTSFQITFVCPNSAPLGDIISIDDPVLLRWRSYQATLSQGTNQQRFIDYLNQVPSIAFVPAFTKTTAAAATGGSLSIDNFEVSYNGLDPSASVTLIPSGSPGGAWKYFVGVAEPSGGLYDPALLTATFTPPPGEEGDYSNPQQFQDWVELRNLDASSVSLVNWSLTDDNGIPAKWKFPAGATIPANGYLIVMCDNRNEANGTATYLHTNFSLSANGGYTGLYNAAGVLQSEITSVPYQDSFHTWGRDPGGAAVYGFLDTATPGAANTGNFSPDRVKTPDFFKADGITNFPGGFYTGTQTLVMTTTTAGATIRYTTDGSDPTDTVGVVYSGPITLTPPADHKSGLVYRARAFLAGRIASNIKTHTYLLDTNVALKGVPALLFSGDAGRAFFLPMGIMAINGGTYSGGWIGNGPNSYNIPIGRGDPYERIISAEWYYPDGRDGWREDVGVRISSSPYSRPLLQLTQTALSPWTRDHTQKPSFNLYWRGDYGNNDVKDTSLIPDNDINNYARLRIRAGKNDISNPFIIDEVGRRLYRDMGWVQPTGTINTLYVNGSFKGMYNTTERLRNETFQAHYRSAYEFDVRYIGEQVDGDATFWNSMQTALNLSQTTLANYQAVQNYLDVVNVADYFLFCIYVNYDDWPNNNWAAQRERSPTGRYRMASWDTEGAFGRFGAAVNYNTIDGKLLNISTECGDIFKRLYASPEFKLLCADRINKHFFNGGVLDDRAPGNHFQTLKDTFKAQVQPLLTYIENQTIDETWFNNHVAGRRPYLFGATAGSFPNKNLWPATVPPTFSQFGGNVAASYPLVITTTAPAGSIIYYTTDGSDPRLPGGGVSPTAQIYSGAVTLTNLVTIRSRVKNSNGEWSAITEAFFEPAAAQPTTSTLVVSEIMYHPPDPTAAEQAATYTNADDFEFIRLTNIGATPLDLRNVEFTVGITFDFALGTVLAINPGASVIVVKNRDAFRARYGAAYDAMLAGEFAGGLDNAGELIVLARTGASPLTLQSFTYGDAKPWPKTADGYGPSLMLIAPATAPNHNVATNWTASAQAGGMPGGVVRSLSYTAWKQLTFNSIDAANAAVSGPLVDADRDGLPNFAEYTLGCAPRYPDGPAALPTAQIENIAGTDYLTFQYRLNAGASDATSTPEICSNLSAWVNGAANIVTISTSAANPNGVVTWKVRDINATTVPGQRQFHLKMTGP